MQPEQNKWFSLPPESATKGYFCTTYLPMVKHQVEAMNFTAAIGTIIVLAKNQRGEQSLFEQEIQ